MKQRTNRLLVLLCIVNLFPLIGVCVVMLGSASGATPPSSPEIDAIRAALYSELWKISFTGLGALLSLIAILNGIAGWAIWGFWKERIEDQIDDHIENKDRFMRARIYSNLSVVYWNLYERATDSNGQPVEAYRQQALELAEDALAALEETVTEKANREQEEMLCLAKQNVAYYLAAQAAPANKTRALELATYAFLRCQKFPERRIHFIDTHAYVSVRFCESGEKQRKRALVALGDILNDSLLTRAASDNYRSKYRTLLTSEEKQQLGL